MNETNPAAPGEWIIVYATGCSVSPEPPIGVPTPGQPLFSHNFSSVSHDPRLFLMAQAPGPNSTYLTTPSVRIAFEGLTPGSVGVCQINMQVPDSLATGDFSLFFNNAGFFASASSTPVIVPVHYRLKRLKYSATASE